MTTCLQACGFHTREIPSEGHAGAEDPSMIKQRRQWIRDVVLRDDGDLIGDSEVQLEALVKLETPEHNAWAYKQLVSVDARATCPLRIV